MKFPFPMKRILGLVLIWNICFVDSIYIPRNQTTEPSTDTNIKSNPTVPSNGSQTIPTAKTEENLKTIWLSHHMTTETPTTFSPTTNIDEAEKNTSNREFKMKYEQYVEPGRNVSKLLDAVFAQYDKRIRPFYEVKPLSVGLDILILSFGELREASMEYSVDMYLGQFWQDPRLAFGLDRIIILGGEAFEKLWVPDTFFVNSIESKIQTMMFTNKKVWINLKNGTMMLSARLVSRNSCKFDLRNYPLDEQTCHLAFESFSYSEKDLKYSWRNQSVGSDIGVYDREMAQFDIISAKRYLKHEVYHSDMFSGLTATIVFKRRASYYIFQMYIPCVCITALSWVSFWINHEAIPARVGLSITTVLTISYMRGSVNANMPRVSYLKSIDYFLLVSFVFIFFTLIEYVLVLKYSQKAKDLVKKNSLLSSDDEMEKQPMLVTVSMGNKSYNFKSSIQDLENGNGIPLKERSSKLQVFNRTNPLSFRGKIDSCQPRKENDSDVTSLIPKPPNGPHRLDQYSRFLFPLTYTLFLTVYFVYYTKAYDDRK
ncbi:gamma-aminobutyric acid receptor subunit beta-3-like isoform X2 [Actinia tenebrosa]|uniref:Gamma-aminobutyric acid receptor subunit beta-3-like isoform X2 n=1 Tax=Actinia tenebrosa TaxID=6105 RepID=A0A6P8IBR8_ACTTE|nr:gamma-aminobutyric acid receptor subunit beta-3-like isoform X2 [Actinia tenebrosa]